MTTSNGKSTEQSLPDYRQKEQSLMKRDLSQAQLAITEILEEVYLTGMDAAMAREQGELEGLRAAARFWYDKAGRMSEELDILTRGGVIEVALRNPNVASYMRHWEDRTEKAESALAVNTAIRESNADMLRHFKENQATIAALQAKIEEADRQEPFSVLRCGSLALKPTPLFARPLITSQRELSLLAVIKQMRKLITKANAYLCIRDDIPTEVTDDLAQALALTTDLRRKE